MAHVEKRCVLLTPKFRVAFPQVAKLKVFAPGQKGRYSCVALFTPSEFTDKDQQKWAALIAACNKVSIDIFKKPMKELDLSVYKLPFHKGEGQQRYAGFGAGVIFFTMSAYTRRSGIGWKSRSYCRTKEALILCCGGSTPELEALPDRIGDGVAPTIDMQKAAE